MFPNGEIAVYLVRVDSDVTRYKCDFVKPVGDPGFSVATDPHAHNSAPFSFDGVQGSPCTTFPATQGVPSVLPGIFGAANGADYRLLGSSSAERRFPSSNHPQRKDDAKKKAKVDEKKL
jgi:hypothetical protein